MVKEVSNNKSEQSDGIARLDAEVSVPVAGVSTTVVTKAVQGKVEREGEVE